MKLLISLGLLAYASAMHDSHCSSFLTVKRSRSKRSPQSTDYDYSSQATSTAGGVSTNAPTTQAASTTAAKTTTAAATTTAAGSTAATNAPSTTAPSVETDSPAAETTTAGTQFPTTVPDEGTGTDYLILLDATGSMQKLTGPGRGRDFVISKFNKFLKTLRHQVDQGGIQDGKIAVAIFNKKADWSEYNSIKNIKDLTRADYNPGWGTNLHDAMGCTLQKFKAESSASTKLVYVLTDGKHEVRRSTNVAHSANDVSSLVSQYRDEDDMQFSFLALINKDNADEKKTLKEGAKNMGIRGAEIRTSDFDGANFTGMLKSVLRSMKKNGKQVAIPACGSCPQGKRGKKCRKQRKRDKANKRCQ